METTHEILRMVEKKEFPTIGIIREGNKKLEPRIFGRTGKIERKTLLRSSNDDEKHQQHTQILRENEKRRG